MKNVEREEKMGMVIVSGSANRPLAEAVCGCLGIDLGRAVVGRFADGEVRIKEFPHVRGKHVVIIQSTNPPAENWLELMLLIDTAVSSSAKSITVVMPYMGYARQDRKDGAHSPIATRVVIRMIESILANIPSMLFTFDLHSSQTQAVSARPFENLFLSSTLLEALKDSDWANTVIISPDAGGVRRARAIAERLGSDVAFVDKRRTGPNQSEVMNLVGEVRGKEAVFVDDMVDTAGTLVKGAESVMDAGAKRVVAVTSHALLSGTAVQKISDSPIGRLIVSDTVFIPPEKKFEKLKIVSSASLLGKAIRRIHDGGEVSPLFDQAFSWL